MKTTSLTAIATVFTLTAGVAFAESHSMANPMVGGAEMFPQKNIVENAMNSADHTTLVAAVTAAGLVDTLASEGPFTVFAPVNSAFAALNQDQLADLLKPENKAALTQILTCHVVGAEVFSDAISGMIADAGGAFAVETLGGCTLIAKAKGDMLTLTDERGQVANITIADVDQSNGVIHVIDTVMLPAE